MASTPTTRNRLDKQGTGDNAGTWGARLNTSVFDLIDELADGLTTITVSGTVTLTATNYVSDQARKRGIRTVGAGGTVIIPGVEKWYVTQNRCAGAVTFRTASGTGAVIQPGQLTFVLCDGVNCDGATYTGSSEFVTKVVGPVATAARASFNAPHGTAPSSPVNGDIWTTTARGLSYRADGLTLSPGVELIFSGTASAVATIDLSLPKDFRAYELLLNKVNVSTSSQTIAMRVSTNGGGLWHAGASDYIHVVDRLDSTGARQVGGGYSSFIPLGFNISTANRGAMIHVMIDRPHSSGAFKPIKADSSYYNGNSGDVMTMRRVDGLLRGSTAEITNVRVYMGAGTLTANYALYGRR